MSTEPISDQFSPATDYQGEQEAPISAQHEHAQNLAHYSAYEKHAKILRTWLVAYGIGAPVLMVTQESMWKRLASSGDLRITAVLFLAGVALQVALAALNKSVMWACYFGELNPEFKLTRRYRVAEWLAERYSIDFFCDLFSILFFTAATFLTFGALVK